MVIGVDCEGMGVQSFFTGRNSMKHWQTSLPEDPLVGMDCYSPLFLQLMILKDSGDCTIICAGHSPSWF
jgi:hypothetical protein